ncbi:D-alanyl-D-alanine carboxypeptidase [Microcella daejeonensis]|uniref:D-alanyl-D-alanine carboxypeptidase n=1 Tax=Microcella daejeonensis TaxID=2994971 RepID=UPI00226DD43B|nr:D-alanyl-D-alanine carboxypeptidase [Microcella daejeonensis]WAB84111.1 D-alanyl-D-alanine carboxypeptidase [Microcella daejeonensis]
MTQPSDDAGAPAAPRAARGGLSSGRRRALLLTAAVLGAVALPAGALYAGAAVGASRLAPAATPAPSGSSTPAPSPTAVAEPPRTPPTLDVEPSRLRTCSIAALAGAEVLGSFSAAVVDAATGELLFDRRAGDPVRTGSVMKNLTAAAALAVLGPDYQLVTRTVTGETPGSIVLVGGGDATLSRTAPGQESVYPGAPKLADLAAQTIAAYRAANGADAVITEVVLDAGYWSTDDRWHPSWDRGEQTQGWLSEVVALQVDGDRDDPRAVQSPRSTDPVGRAGRWFAEALAAAGNPGVSIRQGSATGEAIPLAEVRSQPVRTLIGQMVPTSDNTLAEMLARVVSLQQGLGGSAASIDDAYAQALDGYGLPVDQLTVIDGSGLSDLNAVPPVYAAQLAVKIDAGEGALGIVRDAWPIAGQTGTLANRFTGDNAVARGAVRAKTGLLADGHMLSGSIRAEDGTVLTFFFAATAPSLGANNTTRVQLDTLATAVLRCGGNLSTL